MRRTLVLALVLFGLYAATIGLDAFGSSDYAGDEPHYLLAAQSIVDDHDIDVKNQYAARSFELYYPYDLDKQGKETKGFLHEPHGVGFPLLIAPAYALGGAKGVELFLAALAALLMALTYRLALRVVPDPWALGATAAVGVSPPFLAYATAVYPELTAALLLVAAALLALRLAERVSRRAAFGCFALLGLLPWLGTKFVPAGIVIGLFAARSLFRARRRTLAIGASEAAFFSVALYVGINESLYGGPTPYAADGGRRERHRRILPARLPGPLLPAGGAVHRPRLRAAALGAGVRPGLRRRGPAVPLAPQSAVAGHARACTRSRTRPRCAPRSWAHSWWWPASWRPPCSATGSRPGTCWPRCRWRCRWWRWGLRRLPRSGSALALLTAVSSAWLYVAVRLGSDGLVTPRPDAPFGPLTELFPRFGTSAWPYALAAGIGAALLALAAFEARNWRHSAGATRARYSG